ncbi:T9SS type B sorting domain-containing protein [Pareuzebyella sediminis]|nr:T9SS type B sorting domain-containing protein [Pareuzebyella sediminis]
MSRTLCLIFLFFAGLHPILAQREASRWYFGNEAGLDFNNGVPVALNDGKLATHEGCSTISDQNGNLLFYSDGIHVWDKRHRLMPNGIDLLGHESSTQSAIIVPKAGSMTQYYIFTVDEPDPEETDNAGLNYTLVDLSLNNGYGDVVSSEKNVHLITYNPNDPVESKLKCSEKITAVAHNDEQSIWVITHFVNKFYAFRVDANGVNPSPVVSQTNTTVPPQGYKQNGIGYLKVSPDGSKIGIAHSQTSQSELTGPKTQGKQTGKVLLYDFNTTTGAVSNELSLLSNRIPYGVEFSAKSTKLYATVNNYGSDGSPQGSSLYQFDLAAGNIAGSQTDIITAAQTAGALQLGIDSKIYRAGYPINGSGTSLSVINNPEAKGNACNYVDRTVSLNGRFAELGLPPFVQSFFILKFEYKNVCLGDTTEFTILDEAPVDTVLWDFGDGQTSTDIAPTHTYAQPGEYTVSLTKFFGGIPSDPITKQITIFDAPAVPENRVAYYQCTEEQNTNGIGTFNLNLINPTVSLDSDQIINVFYYSDIASAQQDVLNTNALPYQYTNTVPDEVLVAKVYNPISGCYSTVEVELKIKTTLSLGENVIYGCALGNGLGEFHLDVQRDFLMEEFNLPEESSIKFYPEKEDALFGDENYLPDDFISENTVIYIRVDNENICYGIGALSIELSDFDIIPFEEQLLCDNQPSGVTLTAGILSGNTDEFTYLWSTGETSSTIEASLPGQYSVTVTNVAGCKKERVIDLIQGLSPQIDRVESSNDVVKIFTVENGDYEYALSDINGPYQNSNVFENVASGEQTVYVRNKNGCGISSDTVSVVAYPKFFTPNGDNVNDFWQLDGLSDEFEPESPIYIFDRYGKLLAQVDPVSSGWDGMYQGKLLASSDYWFKVTLSGGQLLKGHFSLKR